MPESRTPDGLVHDEGPPIVPTDKPATDIPQARATRDVTTMTTDRIARVLRYEVPVDDEWHDVVAGEALHVDCRLIDTVEFWALEGTEFTQTLRVFGTGQPLPDEPLKHVGTALSPFGPERPMMRGATRGELVWHLFRKEPF